MSEANLSQTTAGGTSTVIVRQRPSLLLMLVRLRAAEPTLELGLTKLKAQSEATSQWLKRLGAVRVDFGEPHFDDHITQDPLTKVRALAAQAMGKRPAEAASDQRSRGVNKVLTAAWNIASTSAEETLVLVDRLRFEATEDVGTVEIPEESPPWATQEEQIHEMLTRMNQPPPDDRSPKFLFIARLGDEQLEKASTQAFTQARANAERLARAAGVWRDSLRLHKVWTGEGNLRGDQLMEQQRCLALLSDSSYNLSDFETVSDDPRSAEFAITVTVGYSLE